MVWLGLLLFLWPAVVFWKSWPEALPLPLWCFVGGILFSGWAPAWWQEVGGALGLLAMIHALWNVPWVLTGKDVKPLVLSFILQIFTVWLVSLLGHAWLSSEEATAYISLARATYVGGTPVMAMASQSGGLPPQIFSMMYLADVAASALYLPMMWWLARQWKKGSSQWIVKETPEAHPVWFWLGIVLVFAGITLGVWLWYGRFDPLAMVVGQVMLALLLKAILPGLRKSRSDGRPADYGFGVLFFSLGAGLDLTAFDTMPWGVWTLAFVVLFGGSVLHAVLCKLLGIHRAAWAAVSMGNNMSPPLVPSILRLMGREDLTHGATALSGLGFAVGLALALWTLW